VQSIILWLFLCEKENILNTCWTLFFAILIAYEFHFANCDQIAMIMWWYSDPFVHFILYWYKIAHLKIHVNIKDILEHFHLEKEMPHLPDIFETVFEIHRMMICIENHFSLNKMLFLTVGLWPYHRTKLVEFHFFFCFFCNYN